MRTMLTLDDQIAKSLQERAHQTHQSFKDVVNQALSLGLGVMEQPSQARPYQLSAVSMGKPCAGINLDKVLDLAEELEDEAIVHKLEARK
ncbi:DUF2191 domain-containing protein [Magnetovirga frankeli]|uniref:DUF2191 domain-containing protein n=1 Tax=Magnetovirga frankeli TaxID=947516 RepID=UPI001292FF0B|nr:DUF2191 domain-containing protein [gamma proteobacterium SS-5]